MSTVNASGKVVSVVEAEDGSITVKIDSARLNGAVPSFKLSYEFPAGSNGPTAFPLDTAVSFAITTEPPVVVDVPPVVAQAPAPVAAQFTTTDTVAPLDAVVAPETPVEAPVFDPAAPVVETPVETPVEPVEEATEASNPPA